MWVSTKAQTGGDLNICFQGLFRELMFCCKRLSQIIISLNSLSLSFSRYISPVEFRPNLWASDTPVQQQRASDAGPVCYISANSNRCHKESKHLPSHRTVASSWCWRDNWPMEIWRLSPRSGRYRQTRASLSAPKDVTRQRTADKVKVRHSPTLKVIRIINCEHIRALGNHTSGSVLNRRHEFCHQSLDVTKWQCKYFAYSICLC